MPETDWIATALRKPEPGQPIYWLAGDGRVVEGTYNRVWMLLDGMYVYYDPEYWKPREDSE